LHEIRWAAEKALIFTKPFQFSANFKTFFTFILVKLITIDTKAQK